VGIDETDSFCSESRASLDTHTVQDPGWWAASANRDTQGDRFSVNRGPGCSPCSAAVPLWFLDRSPHAVFCHGEPGAADGPSVEASICPDWHCTVPLIPKGPIEEGGRRQVPG
jgi:hypothetical protein